MDPASPGTPPPAEPAPSTQPAAEQAPQTPPASPEGTPAAAAPSEELQAQLAQLQAERNQLDANYRHLQGAFTQSRQQLAALTGSQPQQDPLAPMVQSIMAKGVTDDPKQARALAEVFNDAMQPIMQGAQRANAVTQSAFQIEDAIREAYTKAPALFANPTVAQTVQQYLRQDAMSGQPINAEYALQLAKMAYVDAVVLTGTSSAGRPAPQPSPFQWGMSGPPGGYQPPQHASKTLSPEAQAADRLTQERFGLPKSQ